MLGRRLQEKLILTSLFVRPSVADEQEFPIEISGKDETQRVWITQFQGFISAREATQSTVGIRARANPSPRRPDHP